MNLLILTYMFNRFVSRGNHCLYTNSFIIRLYLVPISVKYDPLKIEIQASIHPWWTVFKVKKKIPFALPVQMPQASGLVLFFVLEDSCGALYNEDPPDCTRVIWIRETREVTTNSFFLPQIVLTTRNRAWIGYILRPVNNIVNYSLCSII